MELNNENWSIHCNRWHGRVLTGNYQHYCPDWDYMPLDDTCEQEWECCSCEKIKDEPKV